MHLHKSTRAIDSAMPTGGKNFLVNSRTDISKNLNIYAVVLLFLEFYNGASTNLFHW